MQGESLGRRGVGEGCLGGNACGLFGVFYPLTSAFFIKLYLEGLCPLVLTRATCFSHLLWKGNGERKKLHKIRTQKAGKGKKTRQKPANYITKGERSNRRVNTCQAILQEHSERRS